MEIKNHIFQMVRIFFHAPGMQGLCLARACLYLLLMMLNPSSLSASIDEQMTATGWKEITFDGHVANHFTLVEGADELSGQEIRLHSRNSVSVAYFPFELREIDLEATPILRFQWRRFGDAVSTDLSKKGGDDRILSLYFAFAYDPKRATLKEKLSRPFLEAKQGKDAPARLLTYLWGGKPATDDWFENPYTGSAGYMKILSRPHEAEGEWLSHEVNLLADFRQLFGYSPSPLLYLAISADTDDTKSSLTSHLRAIRFSAE